MSDQKKDDGGPAFPVERPNGSSLGITLRDYFAAKALPLIPDIARAYYNNWPWEMEYIAKEAYKLADAMLAERNK